MQKKVSRFSHQIRWSFAILTLFALIQAGLTLWVAKESDYHIEKGRVSNKILTEFIDLGGNKQRLKVWLAQYLLTNDSSTDTKNTLLFKMNNSITNLEDLLLRDAELNANHKSELNVIFEQSERLKTLKTNINKLGYEVNKIDKLKFLDPGQAWKFMIQIFDSLDGNDLRTLINDAIEIQKLRATEAETTAKNYIRYFNTSVYFLTALLVFLTIVLSTIMQNLIRDPIQKLVEAAIEYSRGNMSHKILKYPDNEFGILSVKFNEMALELEKFRQDEMKKRAAIEVAVEQRTQELKDAVDKLKKAEFERKIFLSNISHELKTPATAILGEASVTLRGSDKSVSDYKESIQSIQIIGRQLSHRIDDLLLLARTDSDFFRVQLQELSTQEVHKLLSEALGIVDPASQGLFQIEESLQTSLLLIDKDRFVQLFLILLDNSLRYNLANHRIQIKIQTFQNKLKIQVINQCEQLEQIEFGSIFERYYRGHHARLIRPDGLGIGLHLAQMIVKAHYGTISAESIDNQYFQVTIEIPLKAQDS